MNVTVASSRRRSPLSGPAAKCLPNPRPLKLCDLQPPSKDRQGETANSMSRARHTAPGEESGSRAGGARAREQLAESIIYLCSLIADQPRAIDRHIDYFGDGSARRSRPGPPYVTNGARSASEGHERYERPGHGQGAAAAAKASGAVPRLRHVLRARRRPVSRLRQPCLGVSSSLSR